MSSEATRALRPSLCKYKNIFGREKQGVHSIRIANIAIVDVISTIIGGIAIGYFFKLNILYTCIVLFILAIILHRLFCVNTTINKLLFGIV